MAEAPLLLLLRVLLKQQWQANIDVLSWRLPDADMTALSRLAEVAPQRMVDGSFWLNPQVRPTAVEHHHEQCSPCRHASAHRLNVLLALTGRRTNECV